MPLWDQITSQKLRSQYLNVDKCKNDDKTFSISPVRYFVTFEVVPILKHFRVEILNHHVPS